MPPADGGHVVLTIDAEIQRIAEQALAASVQRVEAENGMAGAALFRQAPADLVITDIYMPEQEGIQTIAELKKDFPALRIIAVSGGGQDGSRDPLEAARLIGAYRTLYKPYEPVNILAAVKDALRR